MASFLPFSEEESFDQRVKSLADDELLEIWAETQQIEHLLSSQLETPFALAPEYEQTIVAELRLRFCRRLSLPNLKQACP